MQVIKRRRRNASIATGSAWTRKKATGVVAPLWFPIWGRTEGLVDKMHSEIKRKLAVNYVLNHGE